MTAQPDATASELLPAGRQRPTAEQDFLALVDRRLSTFLRERCRALTDVSPDLRPVASTITEMARGGKRLRATFCHGGWCGADGDGVDAAVDGAAALELFHLAALVHDDVMDRSDTRRGNATAHETFAGRHRDGLFDGDPADFGTGAALLIGDLCLTWSDELLAGASLDLSTHRAARRIYDLMRTQVVAGQYLDMLEQARPGHRPTASRVVLRFKSAKYTVEHPLQLGGSLAGASDEVLDAYSGYGVPVGEAFQLRDDVLGVFGDPVHTGKPVGDDLRDGKKTLLVLAALDRANVAQRRVLDRRLGDRSLTDRQVGDLQEILVDTGALRTVERQIAELTDAGVAALRTSVVRPDAVDHLTSLAQDIAGRTA